MRYTEIMKLFYKIASLKFMLSLNFTSLKHSNMNGILICSILLVFLTRGIQSDTPHLNYRYSSFAVPSPNEAVEFLSKYITGYVLNPEEIIAKPLASNPEDSEIRGIRIPYNEGSTFADIYFIKENGLPENPELPLEDMIQRIESTHTFAQVKI
jgi:hypothetical protein